MLRNIAGSANVRENEALSAYTTFKAGGSAGLFAAPDSVEAFKEVIMLLKNEGEPFFILGNGSNVLTWFEDGALYIQLVEYRGGKA